MLEITDIFTVLAWILLCGNVVVIGGAVLVEFGKRPGSPKAGFDHAFIHGVSPNLGNSVTVSHVLVPRYKIEGDSQ